MLFGEGSNYLLRAVYFVAVARLLGVVQYGVVVGAVALVQIVANYGRLGSSIVLLRHVSVDRTLFAVYWGNVLLVTFCMAGLLTLSLHFTASHIIAPASAAVIVPASVAGCLCEQLISGAGQVFQTFENMGTMAGLNSLTSLTRTILAVFMLFFLHRATAGQWVVASMIVSAAAAITAIVLVTIKFGWPRFLPSLFQRRGLEGAEFALSASASTAYNDLDKTMLSHYGMNAANGIYTMAYRAIDLACMPVTAIVLAAEPRLFRLGAAGLHASVDFGVRLLRRAVVLGALSSVAIFVLAPLAPIFVGKSFAESVTALRWLCLIPVFRSVHSISGEILSSGGKQRYRSVAQLSAVCANFLLNLWLIPTHGWLGAAWASLLTDGGLGLGTWLTVAYLSRNRALPLECGVL